MRTLLLGAAAALAVGAAVPAPAPQDPAGGEPPLRLRVAIDGQERELTENEAKALRFGERYEAAATTWSGTWTKVQREIESMPLLAARRVLCERAAPILPFQPAVER